MLGSISPNRRVKATCFGGVILGPRKKMTPCASDAPSIGAKYIVALRPRQVDATDSVPRVTPVGMTVDGHGVTSRWRETLGSRRG